LLIVKVTEASLAISKLFRDMMQNPAEFVEHDTTLPG
jgi:hypothetical protein